MSVFCLPTKGLCRVKLRRDSDSDSRSGMESESTESYPASTTIIIQQSLRLVIIQSGTQNSRAQRQYIQTTHNQHIVSICSNTQQHSRLSYAQPASTKPAHIQQAHGQHTQPHAPGSTKLPSDSCASAVLATAKTLYRGKQIPVLKSIVWQSKQST